MEPIYDKKSKLYNRDAHDLRVFDLGFLYNIFFSTEGESCGIITSVGIVKCDNTSKTPWDNFKMGKRQYRKAAKFGDIIGFVHTHFIEGHHDPTPSKADMRFIRKYPHLQFNILITTWDGKFLFWNQAGVFDEKKITPSDYHQRENRILSEYLESELKTI